MIMKKVKLILNVPFVNSNGEVVSDYEYKLFTFKDGYVVYSEYVHFPGSNITSLIIRQRTDYGYAKLAIKSLVNDYGYIQE